MHGCEHCASQKRKVVFLDRDGVINKGGLINKPSEFELIEGVPESIAALKQAGYIVGCVTNQGGLGEGLGGEIVWPNHPLSREQLAAIHAEMSRQLGPHAQLDFIEICPHHKIIPCGCRKPEPGMLLKAAHERKLDLSTAWMIGDMATDIRAGLNAGVKPILVLSGFDPKQRDKCPKGTLILPSLREAAEYILTR